MTAKADTNKNEMLNGYIQQVNLIGTAGGITVFGTGSDSIALTPNNRTS